MKRLLILLAALVLITALPAVSARVLVLPIVHDTIVLQQSYAGDSGGTNLGFAGFDGVRDDVISAVPGIFSIEPGDNWSNFVGAAWEPVDTPYAIKNVVLAKTTPAMCTINARTIYQHGTPNVRLWWPLMYEPPGTTWRLSILYGTYAPYDDDGAGPNPASYVHQEIWEWQVEANPTSLQNLMALFRELPFATDEVPLISDEELYPVLQDLLSEFIVLVDNQQETEASLVLGELFATINDGCIPISPMDPAPTGPGTGIANSPEHPACCKLMADVDYIGSHGIFTPGK